MLLGSYYPKRRHAPVSSSALRQGHKVRRRFGSGRRVAEIVGVSFDRDPPPTTAMNDRAPLLVSEEQWPIALGSVARRDSSKTETMTCVVGLQQENARGAAHV